MSEIVFNPPKPQGSTEAVLRSQIENLQTTLASLNQQVIILQETLQRRDQEIAELEMRLTQCNQAAFVQQENLSTPQAKKVDHTLTLVGILINLFNYAFPSRKVT